MLRTLRRTLGLGAMALLAACGGESAPPPAAPRVDPARSSLTAAPSAATADGRDAVTLTATARDASGAPLPGVVATFAVTGAASLSSSTATTGADGAAAVTLTSTVAGGKNVSVSIDGVAVTAHATAAFVAGPAASLAFAVQPGDVVAGALVSPAVRVAVTDAFGNAVAAPTEITLALTGGATGAALLGTLGAVATAGSADFADLSLRAAASGYALTASSPGLPATTSAPFDVAPAAPDAATSDLAAEPTAVAAGGSSALTATVRDAFGNPIPDATVAFEATGTENAISAPAATDGAGVAAGTLSSTKAETKTVSARVGALTLTDHPAVTFTAGAADPARSSLVASPTSVPADGTRSALTFTVRDAYGNPVAGETVTLACTGADLTQPASDTAADGTATGAVSASSAGVRTIRAYVAAALVAQVDVTFVAVPSASASAVHVAPSSVPADGVTAAGVTVTARDALGQPVPGAAVALAYSGAATISPAGATTDASGVAAFTLTSSKVGSGIVTATVDAGAGPLAIAQQPVLEFAPVTTFPPLTWTWVPIEGSVCSDGSPTGIGIEVGPGASPDVVVFLDGGGACWEYYSCWVYPDAASSGPFGEAEFKTQIAGRAGTVLDRTLPGNPYADATFVFVPYCTGDVHSGATVKTYWPATQAWHHNGRVNVSNAFAFLAAALDPPAKVVVSGSSAGGFGSLNAFKRAKAAWPGAKGYLVDDSGPPLAAIPASTIDGWYASWDLEPVIADVCGAACANPRSLAPAIPALAAAYPTDRFALLSSTRDAVIRAFFGDLDLTTLSLQPMDPVVFEASLRQLAAAMEDDTPATPPGETHAFVVTGTTHPMLHRPADFTSQGVPLLEWLRRQVEDDPAWSAAIPPPP